MAWQYRPPSPEVEAANTLSGYRARLRDAEARDELDVNLHTDQPVRRFNKRRLGSVVFLWTIVVLAIAGVATWFVDRVLAAEVVAVFTAIVIYTTLSRVRRT